jgi:hypothetical protein
MLQAKSNARETADAMLLSDDVFSKYNVRGCKQ